MTYAMPDRNQVRRSRHRCFNAMGRYGSKTDTMLPSAIQVSTADRGGV